MARPRRQQNLTPEERLKAALVPAEEQPYPLPEGWKWVRLGDVYEINPKIQAEDDTLASFIPMEKIDPDMQGTFTFDVVPWGKIKKGHTQFADGDVAFAKISPCFENGKSMLIRGLANSIGAGTTELIVLRNNSVNQKYTFYIISSSDFIQKGKNTYSGTVGQQRINMDFVRGYPVPLPPLAEQQRIVDLIESFFARLDEAKAKAQAVLDSFETRRAAILHKAFSGELTAQWRKEHGLTLESWEKKSFVSCTKDMQNGLTKRYGEYGEPYIVLRLANLGQNNIVIDDARQILLDNNEICTYLLKPNDIIMIRVNGSKENVGKQYLIEDLQNCVYCDHIIRFRCLNFIYPKFLVLFSKTHLYKQYIRDNIVSSAGQNSISRKGMSKLFIPCPTKEEQNIILKYLDNILLKEQQAKNAAEAVLCQIDLMKKAILAKAFRGDLHKIIKN